MCLWAQKKKIPFKVNNSNLEKGPCISNIIITLWPDPTLLVNLKVICRRGLCKFNFQPQEGAVALELEDNSIQWFRLLLRIHSRPI